MVVKKSKFGVHSGNTLRASNSRYNRTYRSQSVLVRHSDSSDLVPLFEDLQLPDDDVAYSLNKRGRWRIPLMLRQQILYDHRGFGDTNITLIESHKMKKPSRCISYVSSKDAIKRASPKNAKSYFNVESVIDQQKTDSRDASRETLLEDSNNDSNLLVNVVYPCPHTSSLTHNPKYITVCKKSQHDVESTKENAKQGNTGCMEVKNKTKRKWKRIRFSGCSEDILRELEFECIENS